MNNLTIKIMNASKTLFRKKRQLVAILFLGSSFAAQADYRINEGFTAITTDSVNIKTSTWANNSWIYSIIAPTFFGIAMSTSTSLSQSCSGAAVQKLTTLDGYTGIELSPGVLLVIYSSTLTSTARQTNYGITTQTATFNAMGALSVNRGTQGNGKICYDVRADSSSQLNLSDVRSTAGDIKYGIYVKPGTAPIIVTVPYILIGKLNASTGWISHTLSLSQQKLYIHYFECAITPPAPVNFGKVNITGKSANTFLAAKSMNLSINCTGPSNSNKSISVTFDGSFAGTTWGRLSILNTSNAVMGYIRGRYATDSGTCSADSDTEIAFNGDKAKVINNVSVGLTSIPITWSLCTNGSNLLGEGTAQATINVSWD